MCLDGDLLLREDSAGHRLDITGARLKAADHNDGGEFFVVVHALHPGAEPAWLCTENGLPERFVIVAVRWIANIRMQM